MIQMDSSRRELVEDLGFIDGMLALIDFGLFFRIYSLDLGLVGLDFAAN
jgi:hypothetical protein